MQLKEWQKPTNKREYKINDEKLDRAYRLLYGPTSPVVCSICGNNSLDNLGIHPHDSNENEWRILCDKCHSKINRWSVDNKLQKQIGGNYV